MEDKYHREATEPKVIARNWLENLKTVENIIKKKKNQFLIYPSLKIMNSQLELHYECSWIDKKRNITETCKSSIYHEPCAATFYYVVTGMKKI